MCIRDSHVVCSPSRCPSRKSESGHRKPNSPYPTGHLLLNTPPTPALTADLGQFAYYGAYFSLAIPAALINRRFGYKTGVLTGVGLAAVGGLLFIPASKALVFGFFLLALFVLAAGLSILETSANPFVIAMGPEDSATQRLNLAQSFNPVGANIGVLLGAVLILPHITSEAAKTIMSPAELRRSQESDLSLVLGPY